MNKIQKLAAQRSKTDGIQYVVYVPDQGTDIFDAEQMKRYRELVFVEAVFVGGVQVATTEALA